jgi:hypothetical protein
MRRGVKLAQVPRLVLSRKHVRSDMSDRIRRAEPSLGLPAGDAANHQRGRVAGLPVLYGETKQEQKPRAGSLKASGVQAWLSAAALERQAMHGQTACVCPTVDVCGPPGGETYRGLPRRV